MESTISVGQGARIKSTTTAPAVETQPQKVSWEEKLEFNRFAIISMALLVVGCYGGVAVWSGAVTVLWQLIAVVIPTMGTLSMLLAVAPMKTIVRWSIVAIIVDTIIIAINLLL
ncbi:MAG: hypothetical protein MRY83_23770 [Flavobacteriales bacterium]|nr:hypothetical protein [Flavobacteriales bacterium]